MNIAHSSIANLQSILQSLNFSDHIKDDTISKQAIKVIACDFVTKLKHTYKTIMADLHLSKSTKLSILYQVI